MKKKNLIKKKKKKDEKNDEELLPTKHEKVGNVNCFSEEIAKEIINKLISYTFTKLYMKKMNKIIDAYYIRYLLRGINNIIEISYINNTNGNVDSIDKKTFKEEIDINYLKNKKLFYNVKIANKNFWETIPQPQSFSFERTSTYKNVIKTFKEIKLFKKNYQENSDNKNKKMKFKFRYYIPKKYEDNYPKKRKTYIKKTDELPSEKIPEEVLGIKKEDEDIQNMRKKFLEEMEKKNLEKRMEKERKKREEIFKRMGDNNKKTKNKNDSANKIINPDLFIKEFLSVSTNQKEIKGGSSLSLLEEEKKEQTKKAKRNIEYNIIKKIRTEKEQLLQKILLQKLLFKKSKLKNKNKEELNSEEDEQTLGYLKPSGSNFALIKPEVGVIIQEDAKVKSGGINFYEKYNRFSLSDFNKTMNSVFVHNLSNSIDNNTYIGGKINLNNNITNKKMDLSNINNKSDQIIDDKKEELNEKNLFKKTFMNRLTNLKKKFIYKSQSEICFSNNCNSFILREALSTGKNEKSYYYYSNSLFDSNKSRNEFNNNFELTYIGTKKSKFNQLVNSKFFSPLPTNLLNTYKNTLLKNYIYNADKDDSLQNINISKEKNDKYNLMDTFNKNIIDRNNKLNEVLNEQIMKKTNNNYLPKIKNNESVFINQGNRIKNYFFRTRKKK